MALQTPLGRIGEHRFVIDVVPAINTAIYAAGDALGTVITLDDASHGSGQSGVLELIRVVDRAQQTPDIDFLFFDSAITATTNNAAFNPSDADLNKLVGSYSIVNTDYLAAFTNNQVASFYGINMPFTTVGTPNLFLQCVVRSTPTFVAVTDLQLRFVFRRD